jgi:hypothetical protein
LSLCIPNTYNHTDSIGMHVLDTYRDNIFSARLIFEPACQDSSVGIATGYGLDDRGVAVRVSVGENFLLSTSSRPALGPTQPPTKWIPGSLFPGVKRTGCEADHSLPTSAAVKNTSSWSTSSLQGQLYFYFLPFPHIRSNVTCIVSILG